MNIMYKCSLCTKTYDYYENVENEKGVSIHANCFKLFQHDPVDTEKTKLNPVNGNINNACFNICSACMKQLLDRTIIYDQNVWDMV